MTMSTPTLDSAAGLLAGAVLRDKLLIGAVGEPITVGMNVTREFNPYSAGVEQRRNYLPNTSMNNLSSPLWGQFGAVNATIFRSAVVTPDGDSGQRNTLLTVTGSFSIALYGSRNNAAMPVGVAGQTVILGIRVRASKPGILDLGMVYGAGSNTFGVGAFAIGPDPVDIFMPVVVGGVAIGQILAMRLGIIQVKNPAWGVGDWVEYSNPLFTVGAWADPRFFNGDSGDGEFDQYDWAGIPDASASILATRTISEPVPCLVQSVTLENAVESRTTQTYSIKVARRTVLKPGMAVRVEECVMEPDLVGKLLLVDKVSLNGAALLRKATATDFDQVNQEGKGVLA